MKVRKFPSKREVRVFREKQRDVLTGKSIMVRENANSFQEINLKTKSSSYRWNSGFGFHIQENSPYTADSKAFYVSVSNPGITFSSGDTQVMEGGYTEMRPTEGTSLIPPSH